MPIEIRPDTSAQPTSLPAGQIDLQRAGLDPNLIAACALVVYVIIFPRAAAALFLVSLAALLANIVLRRGSAHITLPVAPLLWSTLAFALWALLSATWSADPSASLTKPLFLIAGTLGIAALTTQSHLIPAQQRHQLTRGIVLGLILGGAFLCVETITDQAITRFLYNLVPALRAGQEKHLTIENGIVQVIAENNINRRATITTLLLIPAALIAMLETNRTLRWTALAGLITIALVLMRYSGHQSSQAAIAAATAAFVLAHLSARLTLGLAAIAWCVSCLLIVPIVITLHDSNIQRADSGLFHSARHRVVIWNYTAEQVKKAPILGVGADATAAITREHEQQELEPQKPDQQIPDQKDGGFSPTAARHAHNAYLQTWYELGGIGALLLTAIGLSALAANRSARRALQPYLVAQFAATAAMLAFSFGFWQPWFQGAIGFGVVALWLASRTPGSNAASVQ